MKGYFLLVLLKINFETVNKYCGNDWCGDCTRCLVFSNYLEIFVEKISLRDQPSAFIWNNFFSSPCHFKL